MKLTKEKLENLYREKENKEVCKLLGITNPTLINYLKRFNIPLKGKGNRSDKFKLHIV